jgi:hypothetical protein
MVWKVLCIQRAINGGRVKPIAQIPVRQMSAMGISRKGRPNILG